MIQKKMLQTLPLVVQLSLLDIKLTMAPFQLTRTKPLKSVLEQAKENGKSTGLVTTAEVTDATPAVYAAHIDSRDKKTRLRNNFIMIKLMANTK